MISGIFFPADQIPDAVLTVAKLFPVYHLAQGLLEGFDPNGAAGGIDPTALAVLAAWGVFGAVVAVRTFRWEPPGAIAQARVRSPAPRRVGWCSTGPALACPLPSPHHACSA